MLWVTAYIETERERGASSKLACLHKMLKVNYVLALWLMTIFSVTGASHYDTTLTPIPEAEPTTGWSESFSGETPENPSYAPFTHGAETTDAGENVTASIPDDSLLKNALDRICRKSIANLTAGFYFYTYDGHRSQSISDGGSDMYDDGNMVYFWTDSNSPVRLRYNAYYSVPDTYEFASVTKWPFIALMHINNTFQNFSSFSIRVDSGTGADGGGSLIYFNNSASENGTTVVYTVTQVYDAYDPTICEVYFAFGKDANLRENFIIKRSSSSRTDPISSGVTVTNFPRNIWLGYMLLSRQHGRGIEPQEVSDSVTEIVSAVLHSENNSLSIPFQTVPVLFPSHETTTPVSPTTAPAQNISNDIPAGSPIRRAFEGIVPHFGSITATITEFYNYRISNGASNIGDGGNDMYDGGNQVNFGIDGSTVTYITYGSYYNQKDAYEFGSLTGPPFIGLMYINNTFYDYHSFSIQVTGDAGADRSGSLTFFSSNANSSGINVAYTVTQVYGAGDPTICEVYFAFSQHSDVARNFVATRRPSNTNDLNTEVVLRGYPSESWIGIMLLSRSNGRKIQQSEVNAAVSELVSAVFGLGSTIPLNFPHYPTEAPETTTASTPPYQQFAYMGFSAEVCGNIKHYESNITTCRANESAFVTAVEVEIESPFGYSYPVEATISGCTETQNCSSGCLDINNIIGNSGTVLRCRSRCCYSSYCNYRYDPYYYHHPVSAQSSNFTPPNVTIPTALLSNASVEIFPRCFFKPLASRLISCVSDVFNAWPFDNSLSCKSHISSAVQCGIEEISRCTTNDLFSSAMARFPRDMNWDQIVTSLQLSGYLDIICEHPAESIRNATIAIPGPYNDTYFYQLFPQSPIGVGEPICDKFILDSLLEWGIEFLSVLKTSTSRIEMCRAYKLAINRVLDAADNRCDADALSSLFPCDSVLRNQIRALVVQAKDLLPHIVPDYCEGIEPPAEPERPEDVPFLPSCSLRQAVRSVWSCESVFTSKAPYSDDIACKTNINRLLHCVANRLQECSSGSGYSFFDVLAPFLKFEDVLTTVRSLTQPSGCSHYGYGSDFRDLICSSSIIGPFSLNSTIGNLFGLCRTNSTDVFQRIAQAYYTFAGARNSADVCTAFRSARDAFYEYLKEKCNFALLQYLFPIDSTGRDALNHGIEILISMMPDLDISVCPEIVTTNKTFSPTRWLRSYVRWRSYSLTKWQAAYEEWRSDQVDDVTVTVPSCLDLTGITCRNSGAKLCESDYFGCGFCYCSDHLYKGLTESVLGPWLQDYDNWENFQAAWEEKLQEWKQSSGH